MEIKFLNEECPICLEKDTVGMYPMSCHHQIHYECAKGLTSLVCPLCRANIINFPTSLKQMIIENGRKYQDEVVEEERRQIVEHISSQLPQMEIPYAIRVLLMDGYPVEALPRNIRAAYHTPDVFVPRGVTYSAFISSVFALAHQLSEIPDDDDDFEIPDLQGTRHTDISTTVSIDDHENLTQIYVEFDGNSQIRNMHFSTDDLPPFE
jgi:hypothetical protein